MDKPITALETRSKVSPVIVEQQVWYCAEFEWSWCMNVCYIESLLNLYIKYVCRMILLMNVMKANLVVGGFWGARMYDAGILHVMSENR